ncbi:MAG: hypothetical protein WCE23_07935 [Candidatus Binatus sp.]|uniref:hypothetical protein n=1 Tax=Candidatus Binatus sp. TaxID=2811406 RepID=UPI003C746A54
MAVLIGCYLMLPPLVSRSGLLNAESRAADLQSGAAPDSEGTCEDVRSKMASEEKNVGAPYPPTNIKSTPRTHTDLDWSMFATVVAPNGAWQVEVHPALTSDENLTPVLLRGCQKAGSWPLFILQRDADMYWGPDSSSLLVVNEPFSGTNQLLFFNIQALSEGKQTQAPDKLDKTVQQVLLQRLGEKNQIGFYLPTLVSWKKDKLLFAVGGNMFPRKIGYNGPTTEYCYGFMIDTKTLQVQDVLSAEQLKTASGAECP